MHKGHPLAGISPGQMRGEKTHTLLGRKWYRLGDVLCKKIG